MMLSFILRTDIFIWSFPPISVRREKEKLSWIASLLHILELPSLCLLSCEGIWKPKRRWYGGLLSTQGQVIRRQLLPGSLQWISKWWFQDIAITY